MPCYDDRGEVERDAAARAGCEMAKVLGDHPELMAELTLITRRWILAHQEFDARRRWATRYLVKCEYCGEWSSQAYKGHCPKCPKRGKK